MQLLLEFLQFIMLSIVSFLALLCTMLIYSLMITDVERKTYEYGMLRALGFNKGNIVVSILMQASTFQFPGLLLGIIGAMVMNAGARYFLFSFLQIYDTYSLTSTSLLLGFVMGILVPYFSTLLPVQHALGKNLRSSLDKFRRGTSELFVSIQRV